MEQIVSMGFSAVLFAAIIKIMADHHIHAKPAWWGGLLTAGLFAITKLLLEIFLGNSNIASSHGGAGAVVVILLWIFVSGALLLLGAELTAQLMGAPKHADTGEEQKKRVDNPPSFRRLMVTSLGRIP